jgi:hypothetical protein
MRRSGLDSQAKDGAGDLESFVWKSPIEDTSPQQQMRNSFFFRMSFDNVLFCDLPQGLDPALIHAWKSGRCTVGENFDLR